MDGRSCPSISVSSTLLVQFLSDEFIRALSADGVPHSCCRSPGHAGDLHAWRSFLRTDHSFSQDLTQLVVSEPSSVFSKVGP